MKKVLTYQKLRQTALIGCLFVLVSLLSGCSSIGLTPEHFTMASVMASGGCWSCSMFKVVWEAIGSAFNSAYPAVLNIAQMLLGVGLLFWLTFTIGKMVMSLKEPNLKDIIPKISGVLFKAAVIGVFISNGAWFLYLVNLLFTPVLDAFTRLAMVVMGAESDIWEVLDLSLFYEKVDEDSVVFTRSMGNNLQDVVYQLYLKFKSGFFLGARMMMSAEMMSIITGGLVMCMFFYFMFYFPLLLLEGFVSIGFVVLLYPIFLVGWVFPSTKQYIAESYKIIIQGVVQILITAIYIGVIVIILHEFADQFSLTAFLTDPALMLGLKNMSNNGLALLGMIFAMFKLTSDIPNITSFFVGEMNKSTILRAFSKAQKMALNIGKIAIGGALAGTGVMSGVGKAMMFSGAKDTFKNFSEFGSEEQSSDVSTAEQRDMTRSSK